MGGQNLTVSKASVLRWQGGSFYPETDTVVREVPVTITLNGEELAVLTCSPQHLKELAAGFLYTQGVLQKKEDLIGIEVSAGGAPARVEVRARRPAGEKTPPKGLFYPNLSPIRPKLPPDNSALTITPGQISLLAAALEERSLLFKETGGAHSAALCTTGGVIYFYEDISRHNALDKLAGRCFLEGTCTGDKVLVFSGRIFTEILSKAAALGVPVIISRSAPTELAVHTAGQLGITLVGFARGDRFNVYTCPERVAGTGPFTGG